MGTSASPEPGFEDGRREHRRQGPIISRRKLIIGGAAALAVVLLIVLWPRGRQASQPAGPAVPAALAPTTALPANLLTAMLAARDQLEWPGLEVKTAAANLATTQAAVDFVRDEVASCRYPGPGPVQTRCFGPE
jgi:hypothetical protein